MPNLRFLNVRFNLDAQDERAIFEALAAYPIGARSQVVREALAEHLDITEGEGRESHASVSKSKPWQADVKRSPRASKAHSLRPAEKPQPFQEKLQEKPPEQQSSELVTDADTIKDRDGHVNEREAVKGLLSMLH